MPYGIWPEKIDPEERADLRDSLRMQYDAGLVSLKHYHQVSEEIYDAQYAVDLEAAGRSLPYEAQVHWSGQLFGLVSFAAFALLCMTKEFRWLLLIPGAYLAWRLVRLGVLRPLLGKRIWDRDRRERRAARFARTPTPRHPYKPTL